jgi:hypothetical protein
MIKQYELLDEDYNGNQLIQLTSNEYSGIIYTYGRVRLVEEDDLLRVQFEFDIHENPVGFVDRDKFKNHIGDILIDLLEENLLKNNIVYTGGTDENRTTNSEQFDT